MGVSIVVFLNILLASYGKAKLSIYSILSYSELFECFLSYDLFSSVPVMIRLNLGYDLFERNGIFSGDLGLTKILLPNVTSRKLFSKS